jgi:hypothetical protein
LVGFAVKVVFVPAQKVVVGFVIFKDGVTVGVILMVIPEEVAGLPVTPERLEVITQVTICPLVSVAVVKVAPTPALFPLTFHW